MAVELFFHFNCHGFKPVAIEMKKSGNEQHDPKFFTKGHAQRKDGRWQIRGSRLQVAGFSFQSKKALIFIVMKNTA